MLAEKPIPEGEVVEIERRFPVRREALFHAWTDPEALQAWFGPDGIDTRLAEVDLRVGGKFRVEMHMPNENVVVHHGVYREIVVPEKLVFSWMLDDQACEGSAGEHLETRVTVEFRAAGDEVTDLYLLHEGLPTQKARDGHEFGWNGSFDCLHRHISLATSGD